MTIRNIQDLQEHLQWAIAIEHATIPPYLCALYSIKEGTNQEATEILRSIFMEEMLHMTLVANILNAVGGRPVLDSPDFLPDYPAYLPHSNESFKVHLAPFSPQLIETLMQIERPEEAGAPPEDEQYETIGQFYEAIRIGIVHLAETHGEETLFSGDFSRQIGSDSTVYAGSGRVIPVTGLESAIDAISEIMHQGEGLDYDDIWDGDQNMFHPERAEVGHYFRLHEILEGRRYQVGDTPQSGPTGESFDVDWDAIYSAPFNPAASVDSSDDVSAPDADRLSRIYCDILRLLERGLNGEPAAIGQSVGAMYEFRQEVIELMSSSTEIVLKYQPADNGPVDYHVRILPDGPYAIQGSIPLLRKTIAFSEEGEALAWVADGEFDAPPDYTLCRCGASSNKPYCDGSHATIGFDGTEEDVRAPFEKLAIKYIGKGLQMKDVRLLCARAAFCHNKVTDVWKLSELTDDIQVRTQLTAMIEHCPSGALTYALETAGDDAVSDDANGERAWTENIEPHYAQSITVIPDGPYWVAGGVRVIRSDHSEVEVRNRMTLCRCGHSENKPFCDGMHRKINFKG